MMPASPVQDDLPHPCGVGAEHVERSGGTPVAAEAGDDSVYHQLFNSHFLFPPYFPFFLFFFFLLLLSFFFLWGLYWIIKSHVLSRGHSSRPVRPQRVPVPVPVPRRHQPIGKISTHLTQVDCASLQNHGW